MHEHLRIFLLSGLRLIRWGKSHETEESDSDIVEQAKILAEQYGLDWGTLNPQEFDPQTYLEQHGERLRALLRTQPKP